MAAAALQQLNATSPLSGGGQSVGSVNNAAATNPMSATGNLTQKKSDGAGGSTGKMKVLDKEMIDKLRAVASPDGSPTGLEGLGSGRKGRSTETRGSNRSGKSGKSGDKSRPRSRNKSGDDKSESPRSSAGGEKEHAHKARHNPAVRKRAEISAKFDKIEAIRARDKKGIAERLRRQQEVREERFKRLMENSSGMGDLNYQTATDIREREEREEQKRVKLHADREEKLFAPLAHQVYNYMNPPNRKMQQYFSGSKKVGFTLPDEIFCLKANVHADPAWRPLADTVRENAFHTTAHNLLGRSQSAPSLYGTAGLQPPSSAPSSIGRAPDEGSLLLPPARSKEVLDPTMWSQVKLQGTMYGRLAQVFQESSENAEVGLGFRRMRRGGPGHHIPDESDTIRAAGTRKHRVKGYHDHGVLEGETGYRGESCHWKKEHGSSSAAPLQDHFQFDLGHQSVNLEFPLGKKMWPEFH